MAIYCEHENYIFVRCESGESTYHVELEVVECCEHYPGNPRITAWCPDCGAVQVIMDGLNPFNMERKKEWKLPGELNLTRSRLRDRSAKYFDADGKLKETGMTLTKEAMLEVLR